MTVKHLEEALHRDGAPLRSFEENILAEKGKG